MSVAVKYGAWVLELYMVTDEVIKEIYKKYTKPCKNPDELEFDRYLEMLRANHNITSDEMEVVVEDL